MWEWRPLVIYLLCGAVGVHTIWGFSLQLLRRRLLQRTCPHDPEKVAYGYDHKAGCGGRSVVLEFGGASIVNYFDLIGTNHIIEAVLPLLQVGIGQWHGLRGTNGQESDHRQLVLREAPSVEQVPETHPGPERVEDNPPVVPKRVVAIIALAVDVSGRDATDG